MGDVDTSKVGKFEVIYSSKSKLFKNIKSVKRIVNILHNIAPVIKLNGGDVNLYKWNEYTEYGFFATDNIDGDITGNVQVVNNININEIGNYQVSYSVSDSSGNNVSVTRTVNVIEKGSVKDYGLPILMYHFFYDSRKGETGADGNWLDIVDFEEQVKYLKANNFYFPTWKEANDYYYGKIALPNNSIILTSDDGDESFFSLAKPVVEKYDVLMTTFVVGEWGGVDKVQSYSSRNISFQSHTYAMHRGGCNEQHGSYFLCVDYQKGLDDLNESINVLGNNDVIAYPFGDYSDRVFKLTSDAGFKMGVTTQYGRTYSNSNKLKLPRVRVSDGYSINYYSRIVSV